MNYVALLIVFLIISSNSQDACCTSAQLNRFEGLGICIRRVAFIGFAGMSLHSIVYICICVFSFLSRIPRRAR